MIMSKTREYASGVTGWERSMTVSRTDEGSVVVHITRKAGNEGVVQIFLKPVQVENLAGFLQDREIEDPDVLWRDI